MALIEESYQLFKDGGYTGSIDEFKDLVNTNETAVSVSYNLYKKSGGQMTIDEYSQSLLQGEPPVKKKGQPSPSQSPKGGASTVADGSLVSPKPKSVFGTEAIAEAIAPKQQPGPVQQTPIQSQQISPTPKQDGLFGKLKTKGVLGEKEGLAKVPAKIKDETPKEKPYFEGEFGNILRGFDNPINPMSVFGLGDFIDDMGRAIGAGLNNGAIVTPANELMVKGAGTDRESISKWIKAVKESENLGPSDEMASFSKIYEEEGKSIFGFLKGLAYNPGVTGELIISSFSTLLNPSSAAAVGAVSSGFAATGAATGAAAGGVGAIPGAVGGFLSSIPYAMGAANVALETGLTFSEMLREELDKKGLEFTEENVQKVLEDTEALKSIRTKSVARGLTIGAIDALTGRVAGKVGAKLAQGTGAAKVKAGLAASGIEMVGGSTGEAAGRAVAGQEMDIAEIGLEGIAEAPMAIADVTAEVLKRPVYRINGEKRTEQDVQEIINTSSAEDLKKIKIDISNDSKGYGNQIQNIILRDDIKNEVKAANENISDEDINQVVDLELELKKFEGSKTQSGKDRAAQIRSQIKTIQENAVQKQATDEGVLRQEQPKVELQEVGEGDQVAEVAPQEVKEEVIAEKNNAAVESGLIIHAGPQQIESVSFEGLPKTPQRETYGRGFNLTDSPYKASDYGDSFTYVDKSKLSILDTKQPITSEFVEKIDELSRKESDQTRKALLGTIANKMSKMVDGETTIDNAWKEARSVSKSDLTDVWNATLMDMGYDTIQNGYEYVIINEGKANEALVKNPDTFISEYYARTGKLISDKKADIEKYSIEEGIPQEELVHSSDVFKNNYQQKIGNVADRKQLIKDNVNNTKEESVNVSKIIPTQVALEKDNIVNLRDKDAALPVLLKEGNNYFVIDGHHRIASQINTGAVEIKAKVINAELAALPTTETRATVQPATEIAQGQVAPAGVQEGAVGAVSPAAEAAAPVLGIASASNETQINEMSSRMTDQRKKGIIESAKRAVKTLKSIIPDMDIVVYENEDEYQAEVNRAGGGPKKSNGIFIARRTKDGKISGKILINLTKARSTTVAHEVAHAVMLKAFGGDPKVFKGFRDKISKILSEDANTGLNEFASRYKEADSHEEFLVELTAMLSDQQGKIAPTTIQKIAAAINEIVSRLTNGAVVPFKEQVETKELIEFLQGMANAIKAGAEIEVREGATAPGISIKAQKEGNVMTADEAASKKEKNVTVIGYHGTDIKSASAIRKEGFKLMGKRKEGELGVHFGGSKKYSYSGKGAVIGSEITLKNPIYQDDYFKEYDKLIEEGYKQPDGDGGGNEFINELKKRLIDKGHDGVIFRNEIVVFDPSNDNIKITTKPTVKAQLEEGKPEGYDRLMNRVKDVMERAKRRGQSNEEALESVIKNVQSRSTEYANATNTQQEQIIRDIREMFGKKEKAAPSAKRILGVLDTVKKVTMNEMTVIKKAITDMNKGAKNAKAAFQAASVQLGKDVEDLVKSGKLTLKQSAAIVKRFSSVDMFNKSSVDKFIDYVARIFDNAEYQENISQANSMIPKAKANLRKLGIAEGLMPNLQRMLAIRPDYIPESVFGKYRLLLDMLSKRDAVLALDDINKVKSDVNEVLDAMNAQESFVFEMKDIFDAYENKQMDEDGNLDFSETLSKMVEDGTISESDAKLARKYKSVILPTGRADAEVDIATIEQMMEDVKSSSISADLIDSRMERSLVNRLSRLIKTTAVDTLSKTDLNNLLRVIDNINNGYVPHMAQLMVERLEANNNGDILQRALNRAKLIPLSKAYAKAKAAILRKKDSILTMLERNPWFNVDQLLGDFKTKEVFDAIFQKIASASARYETEVKNIHERLQKAENKVLRSLKFNHNKAMMSKFKMMAYMLELEYRSNPGSKQVASASQFIKKTIEKIESGETQIPDREAKMLQDILDKYADDKGDIDIDEIYNSFNDAEKGAIKVIQEINKENTDKAVYTQVVIRGGKIDAIDNYVHHNVISSERPDQDMTGLEGVRNINRQMMPSTRGKSLIEREPGAKAINFDPFQSTQRGADYVLLDFHMTEPIRVMRKAINFARGEMKKNGAPKEKVQLLNAIGKGVEQTIHNTLANHYMSSSIAMDALSYVKKTGYRAILASVPRFVGELTSNMAYAIIAAPKAFATGISKKIRRVAMSTIGVDVMKNVGSVQVTRIYPSDTLSGRMIDTSIMQDAMGKNSRTKNDIANRMVQINNMTIKPVRNAIEITADAIISTPDKLISRPIWFGSFANEFKSLTGIDPDFDLISSNDEAYMNENADALETARRKADIDSIQAGASDNPFVGILKGAISPDQDTIVRGFNMYNNFMTRFLIYEYTTARTAVMAMVGRGTISKSQGGALLGAVTSRMMLYSLLTTTLADAMAGMFVDDEEEDDKNLGQKIAQSSLTALTSMTIGRDFGNATKSILNYGIERVNEEYFDFLREGDYDPYKDQIQYDPFPKAEPGKNIGLKDYIIAMSGAYSPILKTTDLTIKNIASPPKSEYDAQERLDRTLYQRVPLEWAGHLGLVPMYKDIRNILMKDMYKDLDKKGAKEEETEISKRLLKKYYPDQYEEKYGKKGNGDESKVGIMSQPKSKEGGIMAQPKSNRSSKKDKRYMGVAGRD